MHPGIVVWNATELVLSLLAINYLLSRFLKIIENERTLARTDFLTGALNRRAFYEVAEKEMARTRRYNHPFTVAYLDLDNFKTINDTLGHTAGDTVLLTICKIIRSNLRETDILARLGGDEFAIILPETAEPEARLALTKIQAKVLESMQAHHWPVTMSIGAAVCDESLCEIDAMLNSADELMYQVKTQGKNSLILTNFSAEGTECRNPFARKPSENNTISLTP